MRRELVPICGGGGDPSIEFPEPSPEERSLQQEQVNLLRQQRDVISRQLREQQLLAPLLFKSAGLEPIFGDQKSIDAQLKGFGDQFTRETAALNQLTPNTPEHYAQQQKIQDIIARADALRGSRNEIVGFRQIEDPLNPLRKEIESGFLKRSLAALRGELPENPALLRDLRTQEATLRESLRKQLGPGYDVSSPGIEALARFGESREGILEGARRGDLTLAESLGLSRENANERRVNEMLARLGGINQGPLAGAGALGGVAGGFNPILARLLQGREGQFGANAIQFQFDADDPFSARNLGRRFLNLADSFAGMGGAAAMSTARVKKDIEPVDRQGAAALTKLRKTPLFRYRYLWDDEDGDKRLGPILELSPREIRERDGIHVNMLGYSGLLHAGVKELDREVRTLREIVTGRTRA